MMKKFFLILVFLVPFLGVSQGGPKVDVVKYRGSITTAVRSTFDVPLNEVWMIWNTTTDRFEYAQSDDVWTELQTDDQTASEVPFTPYQTINATNVQNAITQLKNEINAAVSAPFDDTNVLIQNNLDNTKTFRVRLNNLPTATSVDLFMDAADNYIYGALLADELVFGHRWEEVARRYMWDTNGSGDAVLSRQDVAAQGNTLPHTIMYSFHNTGTPTNATDVVTKAYGDANYGAGTVDQAGDYNWTGTHTFNTETQFDFQFRHNGNTLDSWTTGITLGESPTLVFSSFDNTTPSGTYTMNFTGTPSSATDIVNKAHLDGFINTFAKLDAIVADKTLVNTNDAQTLTNKTIDADNNDISNIGAAETDLTDGYTWTGHHEFIGGATKYLTLDANVSAISGINFQFNNVGRFQFDYSDATNNFRIYHTDSGKSTLTFNEDGEATISNYTLVEQQAAANNAIVLKEYVDYPVSDIGATDKTLTSSDVHKFNYTDDSVTFTLDNSLSVGDELTFAVTDIDSIITVVPDTGVDIIGNGTEPIDGGFQIDSLNVGKVKKLASNLYYAMGYIKPYSPSVSLIVPSLDNANTVAYIDAREFSASSNGASVSPTDQTSNGTTFTSTDITKQTDADSDPTFSFNGTSSRISLGNNFNFTAGVAQSIGIFISADGFGTGTRFAKRDDATGGSNDHFAIYNGYYYMGNNEGNPSFSSTTNVLITLTKTTGDVWYIYENGTQRATGAWTNETSAVDLLIGAQVNGGGFSDYSTGEIEVFFITDDFITNTEAGTIATEINTR